MLGQPMTDRHLERQLFNIRQLIVFVHNRSQLLGPIGRFKGMRLGLQVFRNTIVVLASRRDAPLIVSQSTVSDCGNKRGFGASGWVKFLSRQPEFNKDLLHAIFNFAIRLTKVPPSQPPDESAVLINACNDRAVFSVSDSLQD